MAEKVGRDAFTSFELKCRKALHSLYGEGYDKPLATPDDGLPGLLTKLVRELGNISAVLGSMVEGECHALFTAVATRVYSHLHLLYPSLDLGTLLEPVAPESRVAAAEAEKEQVEPLVVKFHCIDPEALAAAASGKGNSGTVEDTLPKAPGGNKQG